MSESRKPKCSWTSCLVVDALGSPYLYVPCNRKMYVDRDKFKDGDKVRVTVTLVERRGAPGEGGGK